MSDEDLWGHSDGSVYEYDHYSMLLRLVLPEELVEGEMEDRELDYADDAIYYLVDEYHKVYLEKCVERFEFEHSNSWDEGESGWLVEAVVYGVKGVDLDALLDREFVDHVWLDDERFS